MGVANRAVSDEAGTGEDGRKVQTIVEAIYDSNFQNCEVQISRS
jgi:hypothetical protein